MADAEPGGEGEGGEVKFYHPIHLSTYLIPSSQPPLDFRVRGSVTWFCSTPPCAIQILAAHFFFPLPTMADTKKKKSWWSRPSPRLPVPRVGSEVYGLVVRITRQAATVLIKVVDSTPLPSTTLEAVWRTPDMALRGEAVDDTEDVASFVRVGDVVRAQVMSVGDGGAYFIYAPEPRHGVVYAADDAELIKAPDAKGKATFRHPVTGEKTTRRASQTETWTWDDFMDADR